MLAVRKRHVEARRRGRGRLLVGTALELVHMVLGRGVNDQTLLVAGLEAEQIGDVRGEQPFLWVVHG